MLQTGLSLCCVPLVLRQRNHTSRVGAVGGRSGDTSTHFDVCFYQHPKNPHARYFTSSEARYCAAVRKAYADASLACGVSQT